MKSEPAYLSMGRQVGGFVVYSTGSVYRAPAGGSRIGQLGTDGALFPRRHGSLFYSEADPAACREYEREVLQCRALS